MNALRHGLLSEHVVLQSENAAEFNQFRQEMLACLKPVGPLETERADRVAILAWRLRRCVKVESALFDNLARGDKASINALALAFAKGGVTFVNLARYEHHLSGEYFRTLHDLDRRQATRAGQPSPPPAAADIDINLVVDELVIAAMGDAQAVTEKELLESKEISKKDALTQQRLSLERARVSLRSQELERRAAEHD